MRKIWFGLAFAAMLAEPAPAQDYSRNFVECTKELGLQADPNYPQRLQSDGHVRHPPRGRREFHGERCNHAKGPA